MGWIIAQRLEGIPVQRHIGQALYAAQCGEEYPSVKALNGFGGRFVLEIVVPYQGDTLRAVYTVRFQEVLYVLHASKSSQSEASSRRREKST